MYLSDNVNIIYKRLLEKRLFIQVIAGPRQVGKTTLVRGFIEKYKDEFECFYVSADEQGVMDIAWLEINWNLARERVKNGGKRVVLIVDEIQKVPNWSQGVKKLWDQDAFVRMDLRVLLLGSAPILIERGLTESLAGRFEKIPMRHWSFSEMQKCFSYSLDEYIFWGGYPGVALIRKDPARAQAYLRDSLIETTISKDILLHQRIDKPALLRNLFYFGCSHSTQTLSYQKMLGQLQDAGNTVTLANYLSILGSAGLIVGLQNFSNNEVRKRASSPKLIVQNTALMSALAGKNFDVVRKEADYWGRLVESAVGAYLYNQSILDNFELFYFRVGDYEVDFVIKKYDVVVGLEIKSGRAGKLSGIGHFKKKYPKARVMLVGKGGVDIEDFMLGKPVNYLS